MAGLDFRIIPAGFNAVLEFLTGFNGGVKGSRSDNVGTLLNILRKRE
jgi:hypothetical protein